MYCLGFALEGTLVIVNESTGTVNEISAKVIIRILEWRQSYYFGRCNWRLRGNKFAQCPSVLMLHVKMFLFSLFCWWLCVLVTSNQAFAEIITSCFNILYVLFEHPLAEVSYQFGSSVSFVCVRPFAVHDLRNDS